MTNRDCGDAPGSEAPRKFRKKPVVVDAVQYYEGLKHPALCRCGHLADYIRPTSSPHIHTLHQGQTVQLTIGDWIITEPDGKHFYPCKPDIFAATYEEVL